jgi:transcriptional regulator with XRE-family HTH domain
MKFDGRKVTDIREIRGMSQKKLSELSGVSQATISRIEAGEVTNPHLDTVNELAVGMKCSMSDFMREEYAYEWRVHYLDLVTWLGTHKSIFVDWCPVCNAIVNAEDNSTAEEIWGEDECEVEVTYTCPKCKNVWYT